MWYIKLIRKLERKVKKIIALFMLALIVVSALAVVGWAQAKEMISTQKAEIAQLHEVISVQKTEIGMEQENLAKLRTEYVVESWLAVYGDKELSGAEEIEVWDLRNSPEFREAIRVDSEGIHAETQLQTGKRLSFSAGSDGSRSWGLTCCYKSSGPVESWYSAGTIETQIIAR